MQHMSPNYVNVSNGAQDKAHFLFTYDVNHLLSRIELIFEKYVRLFDT